MKLLDLSPQWTIALCRNVKQKLDMVIVAWSGKIVDALIAHRCGRIKFTAISKTKNSSASRVWIASRDDAVRHFVIK